MQDVDDSKTIVGGGVLGRGRRRGGRRLLDWPGGREMWASTPLGRLHLEWVQQPARPRAIDRTGRVGVCVQAMDGDAACRFNCSSDLVVKRWDGLAKPGVRGCHGHLRRDRGNAKTRECWGTCPSIIRICIGGLEAPLSFLISLMTLSSLSLLIIRRLHRILLPSHRRSSGRFP